MRLNTINETAQDYLNQQIHAGQRFAMSELKPFSDDPNELYWHLLRGSTKTETLVVNDARYWQKMFKLWKYVSEDEHEEFYDEVSRFSYERAQQLAAGVQTEGLVDIAKGVGRAIGQFFRFLGKLAMLVLQAALTRYDTQGGGGRYAAQRHLKQLVGQINSEAILTYANNCVERSTVNMQKEQEQPETTPATAPGATPGATPTPAAPPAAQAQSAPVQSV